MDNKVVRKRQKLFRFAVDLFIELLEQITKRKVNYKCNDTDLAAWNLFMDTYSDSVGEDFVRKFLQYGFQSWFNDGTDVDYSRRVRFNWMFGGKAIERWNKYDVRTNVYLTRAFLKKEHNINTVKRKTQIGEMVLTLRAVEEDFKAEFHNKKRGLLWCIANTTLYFHKSSHCATCIFKVECKETLKTMYHKVYVKRGYGEK